MGRVYHWLVCRNCKGRFTREHWKTAPLCSSCGSTDVSPVVYNLHTIPFAEVKMRADKQLKGDTNRLHMCSRCHSVFTNAMFHTKTGPDAEMKVCPACHGTVWHTAKTDAEVLAFEAWRVCDTLPDYGIVIRHYVAVAGDTSKPLPVRSRAKGIAEAMAIVYKRVKENTPSKDDFLNKLLLAVRIAKDTTKDAATRARAARAAVAIKTEMSRRFPGK